MRKTIAHYLLLSSFWIATVLLASNLSWADKLTSTKLTDTKQAATDTTVVFKGVGRLYSYDDEVAKPMCQNNTMHSGEYLIHFNKIGIRGNKQPLYPFFIYIPAQINRNSPVQFFACDSKPSNCSQISVKPGRQISRMQFIENSGNGTHMVIVGATAETEGELSLMNLEESILQLNEQLLRNQQTNPEKLISLDDMEMTFKKILPPGFANKRFLVVDPGPCS